MFYPPSDDENDKIVSDIEDKPDDNNTDCNMDDCNMDDLEIDDKEKSYLHDIFKYENINKIMRYILYLPVRIITHMNNSNMYYKFMQNLDPTRDTIVTVINTHGAIPCIKNNQTDEYNPITITIPDDIEIYKLTISAPGTIGIGNYKEKVYNNLFINNNITSLFYETIDFTHFIDHFKEQWRHCNQWCSGQLKTTTNKQSIEYRRYYDYLCYGKHKGYNIIKLNPGDIIANKIFLRKLSEISRGLEINEMNKASRRFPDLLIKLYGNDGADFKGNGDVTQLLTLQNLVNHYKSLKFKRIVIFDFSCSNYVDQETLSLIEDPAIIKNIRINMCTTHLAYGGKKVKVTKKKRRKMKKMRKIKKSKKCITRKKHY
jgi:hypothetical protein